MHPPCRRTRCARDTTSWRPRSPIRVKERYRVALRYEVEVPQAKLLRIEKRMIHGREVEVKVYGPGSGSPTEVSRGIFTVGDPSRAQAEQDAAEWHRRTHYEPQHESWKDGLPVQK